MTTFEMDPVGRITAGAVGEPGARTFFLQARQGDVLITLLAEKQQIQVLATSLNQLLESLPPIEDEGEPVYDDELELEQPLLPEWRIGPMRLEVEEDGNRLVLVVEQVVFDAPDDEGDADEDDEGELGEAIAADLGELDPLAGGDADDPSVARFVATRAQMRALADHAEEVCAGGRPRCQLCGFPMEIEGHACPATNGHRTLDA